MSALNLQQAARFYISGRVQGVGFRYFVQRQGVALELSGWVRNLSDGRVECVAQGAPDRLQEFRQSIQVGPSVLRVDRVIEQPEPLADRDGFRITG